MPSYGATVLAATVVSQGDVLSSVAAPGPLLPAEAATKMPAEAADRKASSTGSSSGRPRAADRVVDHVDAVADGGVDSGDESEV